MDHLEVTLEAQRDLTKSRVTIDMDAFYAQVEMRDEPELRDVPMAVGSDSMLVRVYDYFVSACGPYWLSFLEHLQLPC